MYGVLVSRECNLATDICSSILSGGSREAAQRASMVLPVPGGPESSKL